MRTKSVWVAASPKRSRGVGPVATPLGLAVPGEDLGELDTREFGKEPAEVPPAIGEWHQVDVAAGVGALVAGVVAHGVGERLPRA